MKDKAKIGLFFGGKISQHLLLLKKAAKRLGVRLDLLSYNRVCFDSENQKVMIRGSVGEESRLGYEGSMKEVGEYDVLFFRTTGKHWEEVDLVIRAVEENKNKDVVVIDPLVRFGKPSYACKAWQMLKLKEAGIEVPKTVYGSLWYLYEFMKISSDSRQRILSVLTPFGDKPTRMIARGKIVDSESIANMHFPVILKGSGGDRGTRVFKANNLEELGSLVRELRMSEIKEGRRYMLQEYIENDGDYRVLVLGDRVLGVMKRSSQSKAEFRNNFSAGGKVEVADLPENIKKMAVEAARVCGLAIAGVDVAFRNFDMSKPVVWEVNKGPQFKGFMEATGIDVPEEIVKYLVSLKK